MWLKLDMCLWLEKLFLKNIVFVDLFMKDLIVGHLRVFRSVMLGT